MIVAEEMGADWHRVTIRQAEAGEAYGAMAVGGSDSVRDYWDPLREAGAAARSILLAAAAARWGVPEAECYAEAGTLIHVPSDRRLDFGVVAADAARLPLPQEPRLKSAAEYTLIGSSRRLVDAEDIARGRAVFGIDVTMEKMCFAAIARPPTRGARVVSWNSQRARSASGVTDVFELAPRIIREARYGAIPGGVVVVGETTWDALRGRDQLEIMWDRETSNQSLEAFRATCRERLRGEGERVVRNDGEAILSISESSRRHEAEYELPILAHVPMEPPNFTASVRRDGCHLVGPTQTPRFLQQLVAEGLALPVDAVRVQPTLAGGGFGRRLAVDYGVEAAFVARRLGRPVKVVWSREDDLQHDFYRTPSVHKLEAAWREDGRLVAWRHHLLTSSLARGSWDHEVEHPELYDVQGAADFPYDAEHVRVEYTPVEVGLQVGSWRSVSHSFNTFVVNCFFDELAERTKIDPLDFHLQQLGEPRMLRLDLPLPGWRGAPRCDIGRLRRVLELVAERAGWGSTRDPDLGRGIACTYYKDAYVAHVAEVRIREDGAIRVERIVAAIDCGRVINPSGVKAQVEGAAMDGVATVLHWGLTYNSGRVGQSNFHDYPMLRIDEAPAVEAHIVPSSERPAGCGEPPYPSVAPAIANAYFAISGRRLRHLPFEAGAESSTSEPPGHRDAS
jgi:isoquinoline 1-oxidoreductase beta subunit